MLLYRLPREPSTPRITVWRKLKRLGVAQLADGLVALPVDARTREHLDWIAAEVEEAGGAATIWIGRPASKRAARDLIAQLQEARAEEYRQVTAEVELLDGGDIRAAKRRLQAQLHRIGRRDYFPTAERTLAQRAVAAIVEIDASMSEGDIS